MLSEVPPGIILVIPLEIPPEFFQRIPPANPPENSPEITPEMLVGISRRIFSLGSSMYFAKIYEIC